MLLTPGRSIRQSVADPPSTKGRVSIRFACRQPTMKGQAMPVDAEPTPTSSSTGSAAAWPAARNTPHKSGTSAVLSAVALPLGLVVYCIVTATPMEQAVVRLAGMVMFGSVVLGVVGLALTLLLRLMR